LINHEIKGRYFFPRKNNRCFQKYLINIKPDNQTVMESFVQKAGYCNCSTTFYFINTSNYIKNNSSNIDSTFKSAKSKKNAFLKHENGVTEMFQ